MNTSSLMMRSIAIKLLLAIGTFRLVFALPPTPVDRLVSGASAQVGLTKSYDPSYERIAYPNGDIGIEKGVCADVVVRALREADVDLQTLVHEDMKKAFDAYPKAWGLRSPDANIDHRRVLNLETFLTRSGKALAVSDAEADYLPGDIVSWRLDDGRPHIGVVTSARSADGRRPLVVHNVGQGAREEDVLFAWRIAGHFRYFALPPT